MLLSTEGAAVISQTQWLCCVSLLQDMGCKGNDVLCAREVFDG